MAIRNFKPRHKSVNTGHREMNLERDKRQKMYRGNDDWRKFSAAFLEENKSCYCCGEKSQAVDHLMPHAGDTALFEKTGNHIALCSRCHNTVTSKFDRNYRVGDSVEAKVQWLNNERARNEILRSEKFNPVRVIPYPTRRR